MPARSSTKKVADLVAQRLNAQRLTPPGPMRVQELVAWLCAVQAQDYNAARWAVGMRVGDASVSEASVERALADGTILRTHALRWTWQLIAPADVRWMVALVARRLIARYAPRHRQLELSEPAFARSHRALEKALRDGRHRTRGELASVLERAGVSPAGERMSHLLGRAELEGLICSGPRRGKQATYSWLEQRVAPAPSRAREDRLVELAARYFRSRGPATLDDFTWWSGLTKTDARAGLEGATPGLERELIAGATYFRGSTEPARRRASSRAHLLPPFDEYLVAYRERGALLDAQHARAVSAGGGMLGPCLLLDGHVAGSWRRTLAREHVEIELAPFQTPSATQQRALIAAAERYAAFLELHPVLSFRAGAG